MGNSMLRGMDPAERRLRMRSRMFRQLLIQDRSSGKGLGSDAGISDHRKRGCRERRAQGRTVGTPGLKTARALWPVWWLL